MTFAPGHMGRKYFRAVAVVKWSALIIQAPAPKEQKANKKTGQVRPYFKRVLALTLYTVSSGGSTH